MTKPTPRKRDFVRDPNQISQTMAVSLRPDRIQWVKQEAKQRNISYSDLVRELIDEARKQAERESMTA